MYFNVTLRIIDDLEVSLEALHLSIRNVFHVYGFAENLDEQILSLLFIEDEIVILFWFIDPFEENVLIQNKIRLQYKDLPKNVYIFRS